MSVYKIKQKPEDFIVTEIFDVERKDNGRYVYFILKKKNYSTIRAVQQVARVLHINDKDIGFAGNKDKIGITTQLISIRGVGKEKIESLRLKDIELEFYGYGDEPLTLGKLKGNMFEIVVRDIQKKPEQKRLIPNYFGEQRFSNNNIQIGKAMIMKDFSKACKLITENKGDYERIVEDHLGQKPNESVNAIRKIPQKVLLLYIHAYQSYIWNKALEIYLSENSEPVSIPLIGFGTEYSNEKIRKIIKKILDAEGIKERDFIIRQMPDLSSEGGERASHINIENLHIGEMEEDELNAGMKKVVIKFSLGKGAYATIAIKELLS